MAGIVHSTVKVMKQKLFAVADWNSDHSITGNVDYNQKQNTNFIIENVTAFPGAPIEGQIVYRTDLNALYTYDGSAWQECTNTKAHDSDYYSDTSSHATPSVNYVNISPVNVTITTDGSPVLVQFEAHARNQVGNTTTFVRIKRDAGAAYSTERYIRLPNGTDISGLGIVWIDTPGPGSHTYQMEFKSGAGGMARVALSNLAVVELKKHD